MAKRGGGAGGCNPCGCLCGCLFNCLCSCVVQILITLAVIAGVAALIIWFIFRPNKVNFYVDDVSLTQFDFAAGNNTLYYNLAVNMSIRNPNKRIGIYYDKIEARALYGEQRFAAVNLDPFFQETKNTSNLHAVFKGQNLVALGDWGKAEYSKQKSDGFYEIDLRLYLQGRVKYWWIKFKKVKITIECDLDHVPLHSNGTSSSSSSGVFERKQCHIHW